MNYMPQDIASFEQIIGVSPEFKGWNEPTTLMRSFNEELPSFFDRETIPNQDDLAALQD